MSKDDYFVIAYRLLTYLYACLKKSKSVNQDILTAEYFGIGAAYWDYIILNLYQDGYISGVRTATCFSMLSEPAVIIQPSINITPKGIQYLSENSMFQKVKEAAKDIVALIPV